MPPRRAESAGSGPALDDLERTWGRHYAAVLLADATTGAEIDRLRRLQDRSRITVQERARLDVLLKRAQQAEGARARRIQQFIASNAKVGVHRRHPEHDRAD